MEQVIQTKIGMTVKIIPKQASHSALSNNGTELRYISTDKNTWEDDEMTEDVISYFLKQIPLGIEASLSPVPSRL